MSKLSVSFTLGKASTGNANIEHNNREFISSNVDITRVANNITYIRQDIQEAYDELFGNALQEYNEKQTRNDRKIHDYFQHIADDKRKETHFEVLVQFGDIDTASVGSNGGDVATKMLDEYMRKFKARNKNLHIVNSVLHLDETCPHLHIDFIPFYTKSGVKGLSKGVSMRAALEEQGFTNLHKKLNGMIVWENSEREALESILNNHGLNRDVKGATHAHKSVPAYKESQDWKKLPKRKKNMSTLECYESDLRVTREENSLLKVENEKLISEKNSPWKSFYYSDSDKQIFVQIKLSELNIPFRESENGFEVQQCHVETIRKIEKQYKSEPVSKRGNLRVTIDKFMMMSSSMDEVLERLEGVGCKVKRGKYLAVKPPDSEQFIRLKSLGEFYSDQALRNRLVFNRVYENDILNQAGENNILKENIPIEQMTLKTMKRYILVFKQNILPMKKVNKKKPFTWENCAELDRLAGLNKKINEGVTLESLRNDFTKLEKSIEEKENRIDELKSELDSKKDLYEIAANWYRNGKKNSGDIELLEKHELTRDRYSRLESVIKNLEQQISDIKKSITDERTGFKETSDTLALMEKVADGTYVQGLVDDERKRKQAAHTGNGTRLADGSNAEQVEAVSRKISEAEETKPAAVKPPVRTFRPKK